MGIPRRSRPVGRIAGVALAAALLLLAAGVPRDAGAEVVAGRGELHAAGNGLAVLVFRGQATVRGVGLAVAEREDVVEAHGHGRITPLGDGRVLLEGFGRITVRSRDDRTRLEAAGARMRLHARGVGVAHLQGVGVYTAGDLQGDWGPEAGVAFESD